MAARQGLDVTREDKARSTIFMSVQITVLKAIQMTTHVPRFCQTEVFTRSSEFIL